MGSLIITPDSLRNLAERFDAAQARVDAARGSFAAGARPVGPALGRPDAAQTYEDGLGHTITGVSNLHDGLGAHASALRALADAYDRANSNAATTFGR